MRARLERFIVGLWLRSRGYDLRGLNEVRRGYRGLLAERGPILLCASHVSHADGPLLWWALSDLKAPYVVADSSVFRGWALFSHGVDIRQGGGLAGVKQAREKLRRLIERGETVLIFPEGTSGEPYSYLTGALLAEFPALRVGLVRLKVFPAPEGWGFPPKGTRVDFAWKPFATVPAGTGLTGIRERAVGVTAALESVPC